jgi:hypothetical protein
MEDISREKAGEDSPMELPPSFPNPEKNIVAIEALLDRVRKLDKEAKVRLALMLDEELDLPYLDIMEREYAKAFRRIAPNHANLLRTRFVTALNEQRVFLIDQVRKELQAGEDNEMQPTPAKADQS